MKFIESSAFFVNFAARIIAAQALDRTTNRNSAGERRAATVKGIGARLMGLGEHKRGRR
jgi:hypothetical protein